MVLTVCKDPKLKKILKKKRRDGEGRIKYSGEIMREKGDVNMVGLPVTEATVCKECKLQ